MMHFPEIQNLMLKFSNVQHNVVDVAVALDVLRWQGR